MAASTSPRCEASSHRDTDVATRGTCNVLHNALAKVVLPVPGGPLSNSRELRSDQSTTSFRHVTKSCLRSNAHCLASPYPARFSTRRRSSPLPCAAASAADPVTDPLAGFAAAEPVFTGAMTSKQPSNFLRFRSIADVPDDFDEPLGSELLPPSSSPSAFDAFSSSSAIKIPMIRVSDRPGRMATARSSMPRWTGSNPTSFMRNSDRDLQMSQQRASTSAIRLASIPSPLIITSATAVSLDGSGACFSSARTTGFSRARMFLDTICLRSSSSVRLT